MGRLNETLLEQYASHYHRVTIAVESPASTAADYEAQFGGFVRSLPPGSCVADLGCGTGLMLAWLASFPGIRIIGADGSQSQIAIARKNLPPEIELHCMDLQDFLKACPGTLHLVFAINILEHIPGDDNLLSLLECVREAIVPGGIFICAVPNAASLIGGHTRYMDFTHVRAFTASSLVQVLEAAGFRRCRILSRKPLGLPQACRMWFEHWIHRLIFRICGRSNERHFEKDLVGVVYTAEA